ncbi:hypothetical protein DYY67_1417 [Candidatus Nitrosotalea sp. TS]|uniref:hypothetical protein n=1 Tax=Candidatus Nitrosotalea sp. TS TaxID=2341020 RepID=UPI001EB32A07|nr:hypothetical protein [Candidatus Nitrosotalea sp. TS]NHI04042.1 hypothetical protein [Candidatus Nitrosotalea sp. TS]
MIKKKTRAKRPKNTKNVGTKNSTKKNTAPRNKSARKETDPDRLALSKNDILQFCDHVLKKWQQDPVPNARNIPAMIAVRTGVLFSDEVSLQAIWSEIISWIYQLLYENAQAQARQENQEWAKVFYKIKKG